MKTPNKERCEKIIKLHEDNKLSFAQIGKLMTPPVTKQTIHEIYVREKARRIKDKR